MQDSDLRPVERAIIRMNKAGMSVTEIAWRLRRSPGHILRILDLSKIPRTPRTDADPSVLRPVERCVLKARSIGVDRSQIGARLRKSPEHIKRVEQYANYKLDNAPDSS